MCSQDDNDNKEVTFAAKTTQIIPPMSSDKTSDDEKVSKPSNNATSSNTHMLPKYRDRKNYLLRLSFVPIAVCIIAFARAAVYRLISYYPSDCKKFGWFSSSSGEFTCDHKPLDFHAKVALIWLATFAIQVGLLAIGGRLAGWHKYVGRVGMVAAFVNAGGMFWLAMHDLRYPMRDTDRPKDFTPFMFLVAFKLTLCLSNSLRAVMKQNRDIDQHMIWMFRGFITSFTTPVIRFYPLVLRILAGQECFEANRHKMVMGAMFVSEVCGVIIYYLAQKKTQPKFWDTFMKFQALTLAFATLKELRFAAEHGTFITGMATCALERITSS